MSCLLIRCLAASSRLTSRSACRFLSTFEELIGPAKSLVASNREYELLNNPEPFVWPLLALEGDMLALARLAAEGKVRRASLSVIRAAD